MLPWRVGVQILRVSLTKPVTGLELPPTPPEEPQLEITFSTDPEDASVQRLRILPPASGGGDDALEMRFTSGGPFLDVYYNPRDKKPWARPTDAELNAAAEAAKGSTSVGSASTSTSTSTSTDKKKSKTTEPAF